MPDLEKVIKGLECLLDINGSKCKHCLTCDYRHNIDHCQWACQTDGILEDALALLDGQADRGAEGGDTVDDLISRAALLNDLSYCSPELWQDDEYIKTKIMKQPAVDAVPVVHGKKLYQSPVDPKSMICFIKCVCKCSVCGEYVARDWNYCSNCGAKMNQEDSDGQG